MIIYYLNICWLLSFLWTFIYTSKSLFQSQSIYSSNIKNFHIPSLFIKCTLSIFFSSFSSFLFFFRAFLTVTPIFFASALQPFLIRWHLHKYLQLRCSCFLFFAFVYSACIFMYHIYWDFLYILSNEFSLRKAWEYFGHFCVKILKHLRFFLFK